ncbi:MAG TPA: PQQ-binding-like beta-propeller repeat protein [Gemmataceae bacterium]|jgi:outer membrane protein assembly factor BamB|nr:PQQ-binding-like beta-propeller repeat protein [Gemmataceae bacterium]
MRVALLLTLGFAVTATAADWAQWRGPNRDGISRETGLLKEWPKDGPKLLWQTEDVGAGYGAVSVAGDRIYLTGNKGKDEEFVRAIGVKDGKTLWTTPLGKVGPNQGPQYPGARTTPTVDGDMVYVLGSDGDFACVEAATGKAVWTKSLRKDFGGKPGMWAYSESPLVDGDVVVVTPGGADATLVALNKKTGETIWKAPVPGGDPSGYASIVKMDAAGVKQYVQFLGKGVVGVEAKTGKFLWRWDDTGKGPANMPTPVVADGYVYTGAARFGGGLVKLVSAGGEVKAEKVYYERDTPFTLGGQVLLDGNLYGTNGAGLVCIEFTTGKVKWTEKSVPAASVMVADGRLYLHDEKSGEVILGEANAEKFTEKGRFTPPGRPKAINRNEMAWAYPAVADGKLYVRENGVVWCYDVKRQ